MSEFALGQIRWLKFNWNRMGNELSWCCHTLTGRVTFCLKGYSHTACIAALIVTNKLLSPSLPTTGVCLCVCVAKGERQQYTDLFL